MRKFFVSLIASFYLLLATAQAGFVVNSYVFGTGGNDSFTKLLLHMDGADASTTIVDSSAAAHTFTFFGNANIDTAQAKFGVSSANTQGTEDIVMGDASTDFEFDTGDFTIDFWVRRNQAGVLQYMYDARPGGTSGAYSTIYVQNTSVLYYYVSSAIRITGTTVLSTGVWYHVAVARSGTSTKMFLDGVQEGSTYTDSTDYVVPGASRPAMGRSAFDTTGDFNGWFDEIRVSKGIARWTSDFTPPTVAYQ